MGFVEICIGNSGSMIPADSLPKLFDAFFTSGKKGGTGLGLAIAQKVVHAHGGRIWCESGQSPDYPEGKVEFFFTLPVAKERLSSSAEFLPGHSASITNNLAVKTLGTTYEGTDPSEIALESSIVAAAKALGRALSVLVVDDEPVYRTALAAYLGRTAGLCGAVEIVEAVGADDGLEAVANSQFDLVITDIDMGQDSISGFDFVKELRLRGLTSSICIHSNRIALADHKKAIQVGADAFLPKPIARAQLLRLLLQAAQATPNNSDAAASDDLAQPEILIIDDNPFILDAWEDALRTEAKVHLATGLASLESLLAKDAGLIARLALAVTDFHLDDGIADGADIARKLKAMRPGIEVVLSSDGTYDLAKFNGAIDRIVDKTPAPLRQLMASRSSNVSEVPEHSHFM